MGRKILGTPLDRGGSRIMFGGADRRQEAEPAGAVDGVSGAGGVGDAQGVQDAVVGESAGVVDDGVPCRT